MSNRQYLGLGLILFLTAVLFLELACRLGVNILWFTEVGYLPMLWRKLVTQLGLFVVVFGVSWAFLWGNLGVADRYKYPATTPDFSGTVSTVVIKTGMGLRSLLPIMFTLGLLISILLWYYSRVLFSSISLEGVNLWQPNLSFVSSSAPPEINLGINLIDLATKAQENPGFLGMIFFLAPLIFFVKTRFTLRAIALFFSLTFATIFTANWERFLEFINPTPFQQVEPLWHTDISFYVFRLPVWELLRFWLLGLGTYGLIAVVLTYILSGNSLSHGKFSGFSAAQIRHLSGLGSCFSGGLALNFWLDCYQVLYAPGGATYGAGYSDIYGVFPLKVILSVASSILAIALGWRWYSDNFQSIRTRLISKQGVSKLNRVLIYSAMFCLLGGAIASLIFPSLVQKLTVEPNEIAKEETYIQNTINLTRLAYDLNNIESVSFTPENTLTRADVQRNSLTIDNIRLWDKRPLLLALQQLQQIRLYYKLADADIDRYTLPMIDNSPGAGGAITNNNQLLNSQQVMITARELDQDTLPDQAQTWVNRHLIYTHGYGFVMNPVNRFDTGGLPDYLVKDIGTPEKGEGSLWTANAAIRQTIPLGKPRIYYGELTNNYVMTGTKFQELDYPQGDRNVYNTYSGKGGIALGNFWQRVLFAWYLRDWQILFTDTFTRDTKILGRRNINQRVRAIAPFLRYDRDPYLVVADGEADAQDNHQQNHNLFWIIDAYTTSDRFPYADPGNNSFNYIRNAVKVVIDAYNGTVNFYISSPEDPIINTWQRIFPNLFQPLAALPPALRSHLRYPVDLFNIQSQQLLNYHMTEARVFYNREDQWQIPREIYGDKPQQVEPYYLIMKLPEGSGEEFILLLPFTPTQRNNMISWLAARSDGDNYGKLVLYRLPKQQLTFGPEQIDTRINTDPAISQQISLWNRQGAKAIQGNLLVIPIEKSLLYVEPIYLEAEQNNLPSLVRVVVAYDQQLVMAEDLKKALGKIFLPKP